MRAGGILPGLERLVLSHSEWPLPSLSKGLILSLSKGGARANRIHAGAVTRTWQE